MAPFGFGEAECGDSSESRGQLGTGSIKHNLLLTKVKGLENVTAIAAGFSLHNLAVKKDGTVWSWGVNESGQIGDGTQTRYGTSPETSDYHDKKVPVKVEFGIQTLTTTKPT